MATPGWRTSGGSPMRDRLPRVATVVQVIPETSKVTTFVLDAAIKARPGQFLMAWLPGINEKPFSIVCPDPLTITVANVGNFTAALHRLVPGERLWYRGPLGRGFRLSGRDILLVAGGYGAAPLYSLALAARDRDMAVWVALGARAREDLLFPGRFAGLGCRVWACTEDGSFGERGPVTDLLQSLADQHRPDSVYACGPQAMLQAVAGACDARGIRYQVSMERYMRCGMGLCGSCAVAGRRVCRDGPVFSRILY